MVGNDSASRERVLAALAGQPTDRVPVHFEFGPAWDRFRARGIANPDAHFGVDLKKIWFLPKVEPEAARPETPSPPGAAKVGNAQQVATYRLWNYAPQSIDRRNPLIHARNLEDIAAHRFPSIDAPGETERLRSAVAGHHAAGFAVAGQIPYLGGVIFETAYRLRGLDNFLEDLRGRPDFAEALLERITENAARNVTQLAATGVDIVFLGDDIGMPTSMLISPGLWRQWLKPRLARVIQAARKVLPSVPIAYHSDGWYWPVIDDLVEIGVNILNPVQPDCMDPNALRARFGRRLALWGTVGSATLMPFSTPQEVFEEVRRRVAELGQAGGLVLAPAYDLEDDVPLANIEAFFAACRSSGEAPGSPGRRRGKPGNAGT